MLRVRSRPAFTLIELLVVVAIIALLISVLLPALGLARKSARQVLCNTNLRSQGQVAFLYAEDNDGWVVRGMNDGLHRKGNYAMMLLKGGIKPRGAVQLEDGSFWSGTNIAALWTPTQQKDLIRICRAVPEFQCPDFPAAGQSFDFVSSAFPIPYSEEAANRDVAGGGAWTGEDTDFRGEQIDNDPNVRALFYTQFSKLGQLGKVSPASLIYVTEAHKSLAGKEGNGREMRFLHIFYTSQLPFGQSPRVANDKRHPGGINAMFFDGHVDTIRHSQLDSGFGTSLGRRLKYFTVVPDKFQ